MLDWLIAICSLVICLGGVIGILFNIWLMFVDPIDYFGLDKEDEEDE